MNEYNEAYNAFSEQYSGGVTLCAHSGVNGQPETVVHNAKELFEHDEDLANEDFSNFLDSEGLEILVSLDDCFNNDLTYILENQILDSFTNGQRKQVVNQLNNLDDVTDFFDFLEGEQQEIEILRYLVREV